MYAFDGASAFSLAAAKAAGAVLITGYIVGHPGGMDPIDKARVQEILALSLGFLPNWERGADYLVNCGHDGGVAAGQEAVAALQALGIPEGTACPFSWDTQIAPSLYPQCGQVADGIIAGLAGHYRFSAYGQGGLLEYFRTTSRMSVKGWLSGSEGFPGFDVNSPHVGLVQSHDAHGKWLNTTVSGTDVNTVLDPHNLGALWPANSPYAQEALTMDPEVQARFDKIDKRLTDLFAVDTNSDGKPDVTGTAQGADVYALIPLSMRVASIQTQLSALTAAVAKIQPAGAGPVTGTVTGTLTIAPSA
jgi:hypothetical protein